VILAPEPAALRRWFEPEIPGPLVGAHVLQTGRGELRIDQWPAPRVVLARVADNVELVGDPNALSRDELRSLDGFVAMPPSFERCFLEVFPSATVWERIMLSLDGRPPDPRPVSADVRPLTASDAGLLVAFGPDLDWIFHTWDGPDGLAASGFGWGAFTAEGLQAVACTFYLGAVYEDIGVVTQPAARRRGFSLACATALCRDIVTRGHIPSWTTSLTNDGSLGVARALGFREHHRGRLFLVGSAQ
jgi:hypothetical protein